MMRGMLPMRFPVGLILVSLLIYSGCSSPDGAMRPVPIAGGKVVGIPFGPQGPLPGRENGYEVLYAASVPGADKNQLIYKFSFSAPQGTKLKEVVVDDISDEQSASLVDDRQPWLDEQHRWHTETKPYDAKDPLLAWVYTVTPSMRVYRFTITDEAGKKTVLYQLTAYPAFMKGAIRFSWGEKY